MKVREPANQYDFEAKRQYREVIWKAFAENVPDVKTAKVLFFPSRHGFEIPVALKYGFKEENLIACEENPAIIATAKWRADYPKIRCYGTNLIRTIDRLRTDDVILDGLNLDYCSNLCTSILVDIRKLIHISLLNKTVIMAITMLKGRESTAMVDIAKLVFGTTNGSLDRIGLVLQYIRQELHTPCDVYIQGEYRSHSKNMVYGIFRLGLVEEYARRLWARIDSRDEPLYQEAVARIKYLLAIPINPEADPVDGLGDDCLGNVESRIDKAQCDGRHELASQLGILYQSTPWVKYRSEGWHLWCQYRQELRDKFGEWWEAHEELFENEKRTMRQLLVKSESEKAQLLQAGRAWR